MDRNFNCCTNDTDFHSFVYGHTKCYEILEGPVLTNSLRCPLSTISRTELKATNTILPEDILIIF